MDCQVRTPHRRIFPVEIWLKIGSDSGLRRGHLNSLSRSCGYLCTILRPILYRDLNLAFDESGESALATLHLLSRGPPSPLNFDDGSSNNNGRSAVEAMQLARYVRRFSLTNFDALMDGLAKSQHQATWRALELMTSLEELWFNEPPFHDQPGRDQFLASLKTSGVCLRWFSGGNCVGWFGFAEPAEELRIRGLTNMVCSFEGMCEGVFLGLDILYLASWDTLKLLTLHGCQVEMLEVYEGEEFNPNECLPFWNLRFPSLQTLTIDAWQASLFDDLGSVTKFFLAHAKTLGDISFNRYAMLSRTPTALKFTERNGQLMLQSINTNLRTFAVMVEEDFLIHIAPSLLNLDIHLFGPYAEIESAEEILADFIKMCGALSDPGNTTFPALTSFSLWFEPNDPAVTVDSTRILDLFKRFKELFDAQAIRQLAFVAPNAKAPSSSFIERELESFLNIEKLTICDGFIQDDEVINMNGLASVDTALKKAFPRLKEILRLSPEEIRIRTPMNSDLLWEWAG